MKFASRRQVRSSTRWLVVAITVALVGFALGHDMEPALHGDAPEAIVTASTSPVLEMESEGHTSAQVCALMLVIGGLLLFLANTAAPSSRSVPQSGFIPHRWSSARKPANRNLLYELCSIRA